MLIEPISQEAWQKNSDMVLEQMKELGDIMTRKLTCGGCGKKVGLVHAYRCYYCCAYFCEKCAAEHFGGKRPRMWPVMSGKEKEAG